MNIINEKVGHINFGNGVIAELRNNTIWVKFQDAIGIKGFIYPDAFENFLKSDNKALEKVVLEELRVKKEQIEIEYSEKQRGFAEIRKQKEDLAALNKAKAAKARKKKILSAK